MPGEELELELESNLSKQQKCLNAGAQFEHKQSKAGAIKVQAQGIMLKPYKIWTWKSCSQTETPHLNKDVGKKNNIIPHIVFCYSCVYSSIVQIYMYILLQ